MIACAQLCISWPPGARDFFKKLTHTLKKSTLGCKRTLFAGYPRFLNTLVAGGTWQFGFVRTNATGSVHTLRFMFHVHEYFTVTISELREKSVLTISHWKRTLIAFFEYCPSVQFTRIYGFVRSKSMLQMSVTRCYNKLSCGCVHKTHSGGIQTFYFFTIFRSFFLLISTEFCTEFLV